MTYSVSGFRQTISMVGNSSHQVWMLSLFLVGFMGFGLLIYNQKMNNNKINCSMCEQLVLVDVVIWGSLN